MRSNATVGEAPCESIHNVQLHWCYWRSLWVLVTEKTSFSRGVNGGVSVESNINLCIRDLWHEIPARLPPLSELSPCKRSKKTYLTSRTLNLVTNGFFFYCLEPVANSFNALGIIAYKFVDNPQRWLKYIQPDGHFRMSTNTDILCDSIYDFWKASAVSK
jgi:hypothetical protein